jgi:hypothetical protein
LPDRRSLKLNPLPKRDEGQVEKHGRVTKSMPRSSQVRLKDHKKAVLALMDDFKGPIDKDRDSYCISFLHSVYAFSFSQLTTTRKFLAYLLGRDIRSWRVEQVNLPIIA